MDAQGRLLKRYPIPEALREREVYFQETTSGEALLYWKSPSDALATEIEYRMGWATIEGHCREAAVTIRTSGWLRPFRVWGGTAATVSSGAVRSARRQPIADLAGGRTGNNLPRGAGPGVDRVRACAWESPSCWPSLSLCCATGGRYSTAPAHGSAWFGRCSCCCWASQAGSAIALGGPGPSWRRVPPAASLCRMTANAVSVARFRISDQRSRAPKSSREGNERGWLVTTGRRQRLRRPVRATGDTSSRRVRPGREGRRSPKRPRGCARCSPASWCVEHP